MTIPFVDVRVGGREMRVSRLGFGCGRLFGGIEKGHSARLLERAYELGIRHFDTAPSYGHGQAEDVLGEVFTGVTDITITTKVGVPRPSGSPPIGHVARRVILRRLLSYTPAIKQWLLARSRSATALAPAAQLQSLQRDHVERALDESLSRLRRDRVDFYCVHEPDKFAVDDALLDVFDHLKTAGRIGAHGLAWQREVTNVPLGWDVIQSLYAPGKRSAGYLRFFHGVLRRVSSGDATRLATAMHESPDAVFIVSASERHQLDGLARVIANVPRPLGPFATPDAGRG